MIDAFRLAQMGLIVPGIPVISTKAPTPHEESDYGRRAVVTGVGFRDDDSPAVRVAWCDVANGSPITVRLADLAVDLDQLAVLVHVATGIRNDS